MLRQPDYFDNVVVYAKAGMLMHMRIRVCDVTGILKSVEYTLALIERFEIITATCVV